MLSIGRLRRDQCLSQSDKFQSTSLIVSASSVLISGFLQFEFRMKQISRRGVSRMTLGGFINILFCKYKLINIIVVVKTLSLSKLKILT